MIMQSCSSTYWGDTYGLSSVVVMKILQVTWNHCTKVRRNKTVYHFIKKYYVLVMFPSCLWRLPTRGFKYQFLPITD